MMAVLQVSPGCAAASVEGANDSPSMVSVTLETSAANLSAFGKGFMLSGSFPPVDLDLSCGSISASPWAGRGERSALGVRGTTQPAATARDYDAWTRLYCDGITQNLEPAPRLPVDCPGPPSHDAGVSYLVLARKYRPQRFADLVGQEHVARTLTNAIALGRVHHAFLFTGARGIGKTSAARILAKALCCEKGPTANPCGECPICRSISGGQSVDVLEIDGASNTGVDDVRTLREGVRYLPAEARQKVYIIDEVHMLSTSAFNALLKILEEPPPHVVFIFATTEAHKIPATILSRCQRYDFKLLPTKALAEHLGRILDNETVAADAGCRAASGA